MIPTNDAINEHLNQIAKQLWEAPPDHRTQEQKAADDARHEAWLREFNRFPNRLRRLCARLWYKVTRPLHWFGPCECPEEGEDW